MNTNLLLRNNEEATFVATFFTHYGATAFDRYCRKNNINSKLMAVPRFLSSSCGTCVRFTNNTWDVGFKDETFEAFFIIEDENTNKPKAIELYRHKGNEEL